MSGKGNSFFYSAPKHYSEATLVHKLPGGRENDSDYKPIRGLGGGEGETRRLHCRGRSKHPIRLHYKGHVM